MLVQNRPIESRPPRRWSVMATVTAMVLVAVVPMLSLTSPSAAQEKRTTARKASVANKKMEFDVGPQSFPDGDEITIEELWSARRLLAKNDTVRVKGTYTLRSRPYATLLFGATTRRGIPQQSPVTRQVRADYSVPFEMELSITTEGYLHVGLYDNETGGCFATVYFGTYSQMREIAHWKVADWMHQGREAK